MIQLSYHRPSNQVIWSGEVQELPATIPDCRILTPGVASAPLSLKGQIIATRMGLPAYSPIMEDYDWPGRFSPFVHQKEMAAFLTLHPKAHNLAEPGTGKTMGVLWAADYLIRRGYIHKVLVVAPRSTLTPVWRDHIGTHFAGLRTSSVLYGTRVQRELALQQDADFYIINNEGVEIMLPSLLARNDIDLVVIDESHRYRSNTTVRFKSMKRLLQRVPSVWLCTGTPTPNAPTDAWAQQALIGQPDCSLHGFKERTMMKVSMFRWVNRKGAEDQVSRLMTPAIRFKRDECIDLPPTQVIPIHVDLTAQQKKAATDIRNNLRAQIGDAHIDAVHEGALRTKLLQIFCGAVYDKAGETHKLDNHERVDFVKDLVDGSQAKLLIFAGYTSAVMALSQLLAKDYAVATITGATTQKQRDGIFSDFQNESEPRIIVADPRTMAHGLTLTAADTIVWYGPVDSGDIYTQANARIVRPGQERKTMVYQIWSDPLELEIFRRLEKKESLQGLVMDWVA